MRFNSLIVLGLCTLMTIFSIIIGTLYPPATISFYPLYAGIWGVFTGMSFATYINDRDKDKKF